MNINFLYSPPYPHHPPLRHLKDQCIWTSSVSAHDCPSSQHLPAPSLYGSQAYRWRTLHLIWHLHYQSLEGTSMQGQNKIFFHIWIILYTLTWEESWQRRCSSGNKDLLTLILSYVFCVNPTSGWWFIKEVNMESLVSATAPHLLSGERLRNNHTGPPRMAFHLGPNQSASAKYGWRFSAGEKQWSLWDIHSNKSRAKSQNMIHKYYLVH